MPRVTLTLHPSESVVIRAAAQIYAAYITTGRVKEGSEKEWMQRSLDEALWHRPHGRRHDPQRQRDGVTLVPVEVTGSLPVPVAELPTVGDRL